MRIHCLLLSAFLLAPALAAAQDETKDPKAEAKELVEKLAGGGLSGRARSDLKRKLGALGAAAAKPLAEGWRQMKEPEALVALKLLGRLNTSRSAYEALLAGAQDDRERVRSTSASALRGFPSTKKGAQVLRRLLSDPQGEVVVSALKTVESQRLRTLFKPLLELLVERGGSDAFPRDSAAKTLGVLLDAGFTTTRVEEIFEAAAAAESPAVRDSLLLALTSCRSRKLTPYFMRALVEELGGEAVEEAGPADPGAERVFGEGGIAATLKPLPAVFCGGVIRALGEARETRGFPLILRCIRAERGEVRLAALNWISHTFRGAKDRRQATGEIIMRLTDTERDLRQAAHKWLKKETGQNLPMAFKRWQTWLSASEEEQVRAAMQTIAEQEGYETVEEFLKEGGYQFVDDYLRDGGREKVDALLDEEEKKRTPSGGGRRGEGRRGRRGEGG